MTVKTFIGCALTAYGPALALFLFTISRDPVRVIILILSAFFWLLSLVVSSLLWFAVVPLREELAFGLVFSVLFQEAFRFLISLLLSKTDRFLQRLTENEETRIFQNKHILSYVVGFGFGAMSGAIALVNVLADSLGPGTVGFHEEPQDFFMASALMCLAMIFFHIFWGVLMFDGLDQRRYLSIVFVVASHLTVSCLSLLNRQYVYWATLLPSYLILLVTGVYAFKVAGGSWEGMKIASRHPLTWPRSAPAGEQGRRHESNPVT